MKVLARTLARESPIGAPISNHRFLDHLETRGHTIHRCWNLPDDLADFDVLVMGGTTVEGFAIKAARNDVNVVAVVHSDLRPQLADLVDLVVWNSETTRQNRPGIVCHPPTNPADYRTTPGDHVTLVNLSEEKGGELFDRIARGMPDTKFLGVTGGYGRQMRMNESNIEVIPSTHNMRDDVYARTRILAMPSVRESWGMVGVEAMASGIPVIAHPTPGLRESLGDAGIFVDRSDVHAWIDELRRLEDPAEYAAAAALALTRSAELDPLDSLDRFADAVESLVA